VNEVTELVRERVGIIVTRGLDSYGYFPVEEDKRLFYRVAVDWVLAVTERIERREVTTITPLKNELVAGIFALGFDKNLAQTLFGLVSDSLYAEIDGSGLNDPDTVRTYRKYDELLAEALSDISNLLRSGVPDYLAGIPEYGVSDTVVELPPSRSRLLASNRGWLAVVVIHIVPGWCHDSRQCLAKRSHPEPTSSPAHLRISTRLRRTLGPIASCHQ